MVTILFFSQFGDKCSSEKQIWWITTKNFLSIWHQDGEKKGGWLKFWTHQRSG